LRIAQYFETPFQRGMGCTAGSVAGSTAFFGLCGFRKLYGVIGRLATVSSSESTEGVGEVWRGRELVAFDELEAAFGTAEVEVRHFGVEVFFFFCARPRVEWLHSEELSDDRLEETASGAVAEPEAASTSSSSSDSSLWMSFLRATIAAARSGVPWAPISPGNISTSSTCGGREGAGATEVREVADVEAFAVSGDLRRRRLLDDGCFFGFGLVVALICRGGT
jgi:hypothetical protein